MMMIGCFHLLDPACYYAFFLRTSLASSQSTRFVKIGQNFEMIWLFHNKRVNYFNMYGLVLIHCRKCLIFTQVSPPASLIGAQAFGSRTMVYRPQAKFNSSFKSLLGLALFKVSFGFETLKFLVLGKQVIFFQFWEKDFFALKF